ncbi:YtxH domain-containing protein [Alkalibacterium sp. MB6]|uniref:YtxH domain-containing protein n=1 Tax=Alkalibacterium sp. MB6 TaxID=2081965 RepID=UPI001379C198|nr:YtxH domain-containing protein [Alkalibacterium sp. MB6]
MSKRTFGLGVALGALTGAAMAYLFAPQSGEEFQKKVQEKAKSAKEKAVLTIDEAMLEAENWYETKRAESDDVVEPIRYERTEKNVAPAPEYAEAPEPVLYVDDEEEPTEEDVLY